jgi:hypothetical protein
MSLTMNEKLKGGRKPNEFIEANFLKHTQLQNKSRHWTWLCAYCPPGSTPIEHHNNALLNHFTDTQAYPKAPPEVIAEAHWLIMTKGKVSSVRISVEVGKPSTVLSLQDVTGQWGDAQKMAEVVETGMVKMEVVLHQHIGLVTDNPKVMAAF